MICEHGCVKYIDGCVYERIYNFFPEADLQRTIRVKRAWPKAISGWVADWEILPGCTADQAILGWVADWEMHGLGVWLAKA